MLDTALFLSIIGLVEFKIGPVFGATLVFNDLADRDFLVDRRFDSENDAF